MNIGIEQHKWSLSSKYDIFVGGTNYSASKSLLSFRDRVTVFNENEKCVARISSHLTFFRPRYDFIINEKEYAFSCVSLWKGIYTCIDDQKEYYLYHHKRRDYSIFRGEKQIAAFSKEFMSVGKGDIYRIEANDDCEPLLIICLALTVDTTESENKNGNTLTLDFGNIGPEAFPFDRNWRPNQSVVCND